MKLACMQGSLGLFLGLINVLADLYACSVSTSIFRKCNLSILRGFLLNNCSDFAERCYKLFILFFRMHLFRISWYTFINSKYGFDNSFGAKTICISACA